jgi:cytochrome b561
MVQRVTGAVGADASTPREASRASAVHRGLAVTLVVLVLVQAVIAGQALFGGWAIDLHGWIGNGSFALGLALVVLALPSYVGTGGTLVAVALVVAMFVQTGLGYAGLTALAAASWHVPLGVAIFGLAVVHATLLCAPATRATPSALDPAVATRPPAAGPR